MNLLDKLFGKGKTGVRDAFNLVINTSCDSFLGRYIVSTNGGMRSGTNNRLQTYTGEIDGDNLDNNHIHLRSGETLDVRKISQNGYQCYVTDPSNPSFEVCPLDDF